ncbi:hypothetical protein [Romboutsia sp.]|uniref:hypothetical protein n=1 Tax=Romboutsia sp. TaxID=1965302 RepID=UPI003F416C00
MPKKLQKLSTKKLIVAGLIATSVAGTALPVTTFALEPKDTVENTKDQVVETKKLTEIEIDQLLNDAQTEANNALSTLDECDFTIYGEWERMSDYMKAALSRINGALYNGADASDQRIVNVNKALEKINRSYNSIVGRIQHSINGLETQFANGSLEGKEIAVQQFEQIIKEERDNLKGEYVNETTIKSAEEKLEQYKLKLELARAVHEADMTSNMLKDADFTQSGQWELMASYIGAAVDRVNGVRHNGIENEDTKYVYDTLANVNKSYNSIVGRINHAINGIKAQFENGTKEGRTIAVNQLEQIIIEEENLKYEYVNKSTLESAKSLLAQYKNELDKTAKDNTEVKGELKEQLEVARGEVKIAIERLENADFTQRGSWEYMSSFIGAAVDRANGLVYNGVEYKEVEGIYTALAKINGSYNSIVARIQHAINGLETQFANGSLEGKEIAVQQFEQIIKEERDNLKGEYVNQTTINSAEKILEQYKLKLELARAVHEANMTSNMLKGADFTQSGQWELMASYIGAAVDRVNGVRHNGIENEDTKYVYDTLAKVNDSYSSIVARIQHAIAGVKVQFEQGGEEGQKIAIEQLEQVINEERNLNYEYVNKTTVDSAEKILNEYKDKFIPMIERAN